MLHFFTSSAINYLPKVKLLVESIRKFHPESRVHLALADIASDDISFDMFDSVWSPSDLGIANWESWVFGHSIVELSTAIKPFVLEKLLINNLDKVIYLDPDTILFSRLDDVLTSLDCYSVALTPHLTCPETEWSAVLDNEVSSLKHGTYNLGFLAVSATKTGRDFAAWWRERCYRLCIDDVPNGLFTDQRWIDLVPGLFPDVSILRTPRLNVSTWNISSRKITKHGDQLMVCGEPLGFYHFTGFDSGAHRIAASHYGRDCPEVFELIDWYEKAIKLTAADPLSKRQWAFAAFTNSQAISKFQRRVYRSRQDLQHAFPDPFDSSGYFAWWQSNGVAEYGTDLNEPEHSEFNSRLSIVAAGRRGFLLRLGQILRSPRLLISYFSFSRKLIAKDGILAFFRAILSRL